MKSAYFLTGLALVVSALAVNGQGFLTNGLVAYYSFDGNAKDESGNANNGVVNGAFFETNSGNHAIALRFNGTGSTYVRVPRSDSLEPPDAISVTCWCKGVVAPGQTYGTILRKADGCQPGYFIRTAGYRPDMTPTFKIDSSTNPCVVGGVAAAFSPCDSNVWQHFAATYSRTGGFIKAYVNGVEINQNVLTNQLQHSGDLFIGGATVGGDDGGFDGLIDDVRVYNRALSDQEVAQLYQYESGPTVITLMKAVNPSFSNLLVGVNYQLQVSGDLEAWTNQGTPFTATNTSQVYPQYFNVANWDELFFRLQVAP